jgi:hypothetical protein
MAARSTLKIVLVLLAVLAGAVAGGCGGSSGGAGSGGSPERVRQVPDLQRVAASTPKAAETWRLRDAVVRGLGRDFAAGTGVGGPAFESCLEALLREALDRPTLTRLVQVYRRPDGQAYAAQTLNILAGPLAARCGHRYLVPEMVDAADGLRGGKLLGAAVRKLGVTYGPYLGVRCRRPGHIACNRVGIDVEFGHAATAVVAVLGGRHLRMRTPGMHSDVRYRDWVGTLTDAGLTTVGSPLAIDHTYGPRRWSGYPPVYVPIEFRVTDADGARARAQFSHVLLSPGWG